jgi:exosortase
MSLEVEAATPRPLPHDSDGSRSLFWVLGVLAILFTLSYLRLFGYFWQHWTEEHGPFGYGYLVPPCVMYLLWGNREAIRSAPISKASAWGWVAVGLAMAANLVSIVAAVTVLQSLTFLILVMAIPYCLWGPARYRHMWVALLYSATMIPWPGQIMNLILFKLQHLSVVLAVKMLGAFGIPPIVDGITLFLPHFSFDIAPACAGLTILFPTVACTILTAIIVKAALWRRLLLVALAVPVSILINGARILLIGLIGNGGGTDLATRLHDASGLVGVIICVLLLSGIGALIGCGKYDDRYMPSWAREEPS